MPAIDRLPAAERLGVPRVGRRSEGNLPLAERLAEGLHQDCGKREEARARLLSRLRIADLLGRGRRPGDVLATRGSARPAPALAADEADLVPVVARLGAESGARPEGGAAVTCRSALRGPIGKVDERAHLRLLPSDGRGGRLVR